MLDLLSRIISLPSSLWSKLARRKRMEQSLDDELRAYVDALAAEYERKGVTPAEARRAALIDTGGIEQVKEATRDAWAGDTIASAVRELRYALRALRRSPTFLAIAVVTLALGIGGAAAVFTVIKGSLLRPLPAVGNPEELVTVERAEKNDAVGEVSYPDYRDILAQMTTLTGLAGFNGTSTKLEDAAGPSREWISYVTDNFFTVLAVKPVAGRFFFATADGGSSETAQVVVLGHALWQRRYGGSPNVIGSTIRLNGSPFTIIGVAPPRFIGAMATHPMELFTPIVPDNRGDIDFTSRRDNWLRLVGRLASGRTIADAQRELETIAARLAAAYPETNRGRSALVLPRTGMTASERNEMSRVPRLLTLAVTMLLLIACGNVAGLSLVRSAARRRELATRIALGASRGALVRQVVLEGSLIAVGAGLLGVFVARLLVQSATLVETVVSMSDMDLRLDVRVLAVAIVASTVTAILVSVVPAMQVFGLAPGTVLKDGGGAGRRSLRGQRLLVMAQVSASLVLLSASAITYSAFRRVLGAHDRFEPSALTDSRLDADAAMSDTVAQMAFFRKVLERAAADPDVEQVALATTVPPFQWSASLLVFRQGEEPPRGSSAEQRTAVGLRVSSIQASESFFRVMRMRVLRGRAFAPSDTRTSEPVVVVSRRMAEVLWPGLDPIGRVLTWNPITGPARPPLRVIGVAEDTREASLNGAPPLAMYLSIEQRPHPRLNLLVRGRNGEPVPVTSIRRLVVSIDPRVTVLGGQTLRDRLLHHTRPQRTASAWVGVFAALALLLAAMGLYGVMAQSVMQRTRELAVRSALGASPRRILATVLGGGMRLAASGLVLGGAGTLVGVRVLRSLFAGVEANDVWPMVAAATVLAGAMLVAAYLPASRASKLNSVSALRSD
jgi:predicted permease